MENVMEQSQKLHTAEHLFARCLQNQGLDLKVRKVDTQRADGVGEAFLIGIIPIEKLLAAEQVTVQMIAKELAVSSEEFADLNAAKGRFPKLRFNEEMLNGVKGIKVVKIGDFDFAACGQKHVSNTKEIIAFAISDIVYPSGETRITFRAGSDAIEYLLKVKGKVLEIASLDNFEAERIGDRYNNIKKSLKELNEDTDSIIEAVLRLTSKPNIYLKTSNLNLLYKQLNSYVKKNPEKYVIVFNDNQLLGLKGEDCKTEMDKIGNDLKEAKAFVGAIKSDSISGKVLNAEKTQELLEHLSV